MSSPGYVELALYDILGRRIADLDKGYKSAGTYSVRWDGGAQATGMYFCRLTVRETWDSPASMMHTQKLVLLR